MTADRLLPASEVAEIIGLSIRTVQDMMRKRELPACQVTKRRRMVPAGELAKWIKQNTVSVDPSSTGSRQASGMSYGDRTAENAVFLHAKPTDTKPSDS
jgi:excisionase family DNA binding protein